MLPLAPVELALVGPARETVLYSLVLRPHRSLRRGQIRELALWIAILFALTAGQLALRGLWPAALWLAVSGFGMAGALHLSHRQRRHFELIRLGAREIELLRVAPPRRVRRAVLPRAWTRVELTRDTAGRPHLFLRHREHRLLLGSLLPPDERPAVASELRQALLQFR